MNELKGETMGRFAVYPDLRHLASTKKAGQLLLVPLSFFFGGISKIRTRKIEIEITLKISFDWPK